MGLMELRGLDNTLVDYMENRGLDITRNIQQVAEHNFQGLVKSAQPNFDVETASPFTEETFSLQESLIIDLIALAREIDVEWPQYYNYLVSERKLNNLLKYLFFPAAYFPFKNYFKKIMADNHKYVQ